MYKRRFDDEVKVNILVVVYVLKILLILDIW